MNLSVARYVLLKELSMLKSKLKRYFWIAARFCVLGPLALLIVLGDNAELLFDALDKHMPPED